MRERKGSDIETHIRRGADCGHCSYCKVSSSLCDQFRPTLLNSLMADACRQAKCAVLRGHAGGVQCARFSPNGKLLMTASDDKTIKVSTVLPSQPLFAAVRQPSI